MPRGIIPPQTPESKTTKTAENGIDTAVSKSVGLIRPSLNIRFRITVFLRIYIVLSKPLNRWFIYLIHLLFRIKISAIVVISSLMRLNLSGRADRYQFEFTMVFLR